jgi:hypothetical protein
MVGPPGEIGIELDVERVLDVTASGVVNLESREENDSVLLSRRDDVRGRSNTAGRRVVSTDGTSRRA